jgi:hypothetical protein
VQSVQMSTTKFDFGNTAMSIKVTLRNPNTFPVSYASNFTSARFSGSPANGTLGAGEQASFAVNFDRAGAVADTKNFPTGPFTHSLTLTTAAEGGSSTATRTATLYGAIVRTTSPSTTTSTTTSTTVAPITIAVRKVSGTVTQCSTLTIRAVVATNGAIAPKKVVAEARFVNMNDKPIGVANGLTMALGTDGLWRTFTSIPAGTAKVLLTVRAETTSGASGQATGSVATAC